MTNPEQTATISKTEYNQLLADARKLTCLENGGVDNWEWYSEALKDLREWNAREPIE